MDVSTGLIITVVLAGLLCLRRRRTPSDAELHDLKRRQCASRWLGKGDE